MPPSVRSSLVFKQVPKSIHLVGKRPVLTYTEGEFDAAVDEAYQKGRDDVRRELEPKLNAARETLASVTEGALSKLVERHDEALNQVRALLPKLIAEATARVVGALPIDGAFVRSVANDLLADITPGSEPVEVQLCPLDLGKVGDFTQELRHKFPMLRLVGNDELSPGDCLVKTRFGVTDGRMSSKLHAIEGLLS